MSLPERPNLEYLKKLAKDRLPALRRANPAAKLADAQLAVAREHGFAPAARARDGVKRSEPAQARIGERGDGHESDQGEPAHAQRRAHAEQ